MLMTKWVLYHAPKIVISQDESNIAYIVSHLFLSHPDDGSHSVIRNIDEKKSLHNLIKKLTVHKMSTYIDNSK